MLIKLFVFVSRENGGKRGEMKICGFLFSGGACLFHKITGDFFHLNYIL